jgi:hypothetical protein
MFSEIGFTSLAGGFDANFGGTNFDTTVRYQSYLDEGNVLFALDTPIGDSGVQSASNYSGLYTGPGPSGSPYSLTQLLTITANGSGASMSGDFELKQVPEPASILGLGTVLFLVGLKLRRKKA